MCTEKACLLVLLKIVVTFLEIVGTGYNPSSLLIPFPSIFCTHMSRRHTHGYATPRKKTLWTNGNACHKKLLYLTLGIPFTYPNYVRK